MPHTPHRLDITWPENIEQGTPEANAYAMERIFEKGSELLSSGERALFEVWYPDTTAADFDVIEVSPDGELLPVAPYDPAVAARVAELVSAD